jgi:hypothetical protein
MFGLPTETIVIVGGAFVFFTILLILWVCISEVRHNG